MIDSIQADSIITSILESPSESRSIEFKPSIPWRDLATQIDLQNVIKSILGMSNIKDGGKIILGVPQQKDKTFRLQGMNKEHLETFEQDRIYDIIQNYGNPRPIFDVKNMEYKKRHFIVFIVHEFLYSPVICIKNGKANATEPLCRGAIYTRTYKPETKKVDNETEMREILDLALDKEIENLTPRVQKLLKTPKLGYLALPTEEDTKKYFDELKDLRW